VLVTILDVNPGDTITIPENFGSPLSSSTYAGDVTASMPGLYQPNSDAGTYTYGVDYGCGATSGIDPTSKPVTSVYSNCVPTDQMVHGVLIAYDSSYNPVATSTGSGTLAAMAATVNFGAWVTTPGTTFTLTDAPANASNLSVGGNLHADGLSFAYSFYAGTTPGGGGTFLMPFDKTAFTGMDYGITVSPSGGGFSSQQTISSAGQPPVDTVAVDLNKQLLPAVVYGGTEIAADGHVQFDWATTGDMSKADFGSATFQWQGSTYTDQHRWSIAFPPSTASGLEVPTLPTDIDPAYPPPAGQSFGTPNVTFYDLDSVSGYDAAKAVFPAFIVNPTGTLVVSSLD
jgi:hypothetical protein